MRDRGPKDDRTAGSGGHRAGEDGAGEVTEWMSMGLGSGRAGRPAPQGSDAGPGRHDEAAAGRGGAEGGSSCRDWMGGARVGAGSGSTAAADKMRQAAKQVVRDGGTCPWF